MYINDKVLKTILTDFKNRVESKDEAIKSLIKDTVSISVVSQLPSSGVAGTLYVVGSDEKGYTLSVYSGDKFITVSTSTTTEGGMKYKVVSELPSTGDANTLYFAGTDDAYVVAIYDNSKWVKVSGNATEESLSEEEVRQFITELWA